MGEGHTVKLWYVIVFFPLTYLHFLPVKPEVTSAIVIGKSLRYWILFNVHCMFKALLHTVCLIPEGESMLRTIGLYKAFGNQNNFREVFIRLIL